MIFVRSRATIWILQNALKAQQDKEGEDLSDAVRQLDFEFVLFSSSVIDYDYIIGLVAKNLHNKPSQKIKMTKEQIINLLSSSSNLQDERDEIIDFINALEIGDKLTEAVIREGYQKFKDEKFAQVVSGIAKKHSITP